MFTTCKQAFLRVEKTTKINPTVVTILYECCGGMLLEEFIMADPEILYQNIREELIAKFATQIPTNSGYGDSSSKTFNERMFKCEMIQEIQSELLTIYFEGNFDLLLRSVRIKKELLQMEIFTYSLKDLDDEPEVVSGQIVNDYSYETEY